MKELIAQIWKQLKPPQAFSWQTMVLLCVFSWVMSLLASTLLVREFLARMGWLFLMVGLGWALSGVKWNLLGLVIRPGPWITGAMLSGLLFYGWPNDPLAYALISWPIFSAAIATVLKLFPNLTFRLPDPQTRQELIVLTLLSFVFSCWFRFHFFIQDWLTQYPSLLADDFSQSSFVVRLDQTTTNLPRGVLLLNLAEVNLKRTLGSIPWSEVEQWLFNIDSSVTFLQSQVRQQVPPLDEDELWVFQGVILPYQPEYTLSLRVIWSGPGSRPEGYYLEKLCLIRQAANPAALQGGDPSVPPPPATATVECQPVGDKIWIGSER